MYQALEVASSEAAAPAAASALYIYYVVVGGRFAPPYKYMVKYIKHKQQQEQQFQSLLPPELDTLTLHEGRLPSIKGGLPLFRPLEYGAARTSLGNSRYECRSVLFKAIGKEAKQHLGKFKAQELANTAWAYATVGELDTVLLAALADEAKPRLGEFES